MTSTDARIPTERGRRTRARLVAAAWRVFERDGYLDARITDISRAAKVAHGTFYTYFPSKEAIFREVIVGVQADMLAGDESAELHVGGDSGGGRRGPIERIDAANRAYLAGYRRNAKLMGLMEQVSTFNDDLRRLRLDVRRVYHTRAARAITRWQAEGIADPELDPWYAASALCNMVDRFAYTWLVLGEHFEEEQAAETLTRLWVQGIQLQPGSPRRRSGRNRR
ncbi:MAG: TetR/AcrR family transcriptional regulator [Acidimicrobiaceae bacterium]|nr:TetR/AcrR family transcriptional regulator [Acidimicrobiaceae bacterium]